MLPCCWTCGRPQGSPAAPSPPAATRLTDQRHVALCVLQGCNELAAALPPRHMLHAHMRQLGAGRPGRSCCWHNKPFAPGLPSTKHPSLFLSPPLPLSCPTPLLPCPAPPCPFPCPAPHLPCSTTLSACCWAWSGAAQPTPSACTLRHEGRPTCGGRGRAAWGCWCTARRRPTAAHWSSGCESWS